MTGVDLVGVSKVYARQVMAVDTLELSVAQGEWLALLGPSGCGKTTTLRMIAGLERPSAGEIRIAGRIVNDVPAKDRGVAMMFQNFALYPHLSVRGNLSFALQLREPSGGPFAWLACMLSSRRRAARASRRAECGRRIQRVAGMLGIDELLERRVQGLSGGQRQRVALARVIVGQPQVWLFDEPLSNLDAGLRVQTRGELKRLRKQFNCTMIYVTHDQTEALALGDRLAVMRAGRIEQVGAPQHLYDEPANSFVASFLGSPPMNLVAGRLESDEEGWKFCSPAGWSLGLQKTAVSANLPAAFTADRPVTFGVRPEDIVLEEKEIASGDSAGNQAKLPTIASTPVAGRVAFVETLGDTTLAEVDVGPACPPSARAAQTDRLLCKAPSTVSWTEGQTVLARLAARRWHLFDTETGEAFFHGSSRVSFR